MNYWLVKSDPETYSWADLVRQRETFWDGVRNFQARNYLKAMQNGDLVLFYHSNKQPAVVGIAQVIRTAYQDPTTTDPQWVAVDLAFHSEFAQPVPLAAIKAEPRLAKIGLVKQSRLSVMPLREEEFNLIVAMGNPNAQ
ncbi:MAG: EVE domain-containing protein [Cytophagales bacterium]|nr:EVE domain-containing protein [Bernardetiaceae bacterium]MDW8210378.1 EVE domain-containing protein [Cytophagales bacterium]